MLFVATDAAATSPAAGATAPAQAARRPHARTPSCSRTSRRAVSGSSRSPSRATWRSTGRRASAGTRRRRPTSTRPCPPRPAPSCVTAFDVGGPRCATRVVQQLTGLAVTRFVARRPRRRRPAGRRRAAAWTSAWSDRCSTACSARSFPCREADPRRPARAATSRAPPTCGASPPSDHGRIERQQRVLAAVLGQGALARRPAGPRSAGCPRARARTARWSPTGRARPGARAGPVAAGQRGRRRHVRHRPGGGRDQRPGQPGAAGPEATALFTAVRGDTPLPAPPRNPGAATGPAPADVTSTSSTRRVARARRRRSVERWAISASTWARWATRHSRRRRPSSASRRTARRRRSCSPSTVPSATTVPDPGGARGAAARARADRSTTWCAPRARWPDRWPTPPLPTAPEPTRRAAPADLQLWPRCFDQRSPAVHVATLLGEGVPSTLGGCATPTRSSSTGLADALADMCVQRGRRHGEGHPRAAGSRSPARRGGHRRGRPGRRHARRRRGEGVRAARPAGAGGHGPADRVSAIHGAGDIERMGDLALHVAQAARRRHPQPVLPAEVAPYFAEMGRVGVALALKAADVIRTRDLDRGRGARDRRRRDGRPAPAHVHGADGPALDPRRRPGRRHHPARPGSTSATPTTRSPSRAASSTS